MNREPSTQKAEADSSGASHLRNDNKEFLGVSQSADAVDLPPVIDSHAHLDSARFDDDREAMLLRARPAGVAAVLSIGIGDGPDTMHRAADIADQYAGREDMPAIYATAGVHPHEAAFWDETAAASLAELCQRDRVIGLGEIGLDYFYDNSPREQQRAAFLAQMDIAAKAKLPIILHCRPSEGSENAWDDTLALLEEHWAHHNLGGVLHCFTGSAEHARRGLAIGFMISFAGNITFPKAQAIRDVLPLIPEDRLLVETDAPFLAPVPFRGKRNEPAWVAQTAQHAAMGRNDSAQHLRAITTANFVRFFGQNRPVATPLT